MGRALEPIAREIRVGTDFGQKHDPTALCVVEAQLRNYELSDEGQPRGGELFFVVRNLTRLPLGTPYPTVIDKLVEADRKLRERYPKFTPHHWVDATGATALVDELHKRRLKLYPVLLVGGMGASWEAGPVYRELHLSKARLVNKLQVLIEYHRIILPPDHPEVPAMVSELQNYEIRQTEAIMPQFGAFKIGAHDDMATALGLACWQEPKPAPAMAQREISIEDYRRASRGVARDRGRRSQRRR